MVLARFIHANLYLGVRFHKRRYAYKISLDLTSLTLLSWLKLSFYDNLSDHTFYCFKTWNWLWFEFCYLFFVLNIFFFVILLVFSCQMKILVFYIFLFFRNYNFKSSKLQKIIIIILFFLWRWNGNENKKPNLNCLLKRPWKQTSIKLKLLW